MRFWIIDDDDIFLFGAKRMIQKTSFTCELRTFQNPEEALATLLKCTTENLPELIFLDINMPIIDGWDILDAIQDNAMADKFKIFVTTSSIDPQDTIRIENHPLITGHIEKPISIEKLGDLFDELQVKK